ncbi:MAG: hypothetical protein HQM10_02845 [Candidatus Riflebacteria bacterium]|nr:hypothetical protein [Candidatus Riflebacteria bacterium]
MSKNSKLKLSILLLMTLCIAFQHNPCFSRTKTLNPEEVENLRLLGPNNIPVKVLVGLDSSNPGNQKFVSDLIKLVEKINTTENLAEIDEVIKVHVVPSAYDLKTNFEEIKKTVNEQTLKKYVEFNRSITINGDIWMQDWGEIGTVKIKNQKKPQLMVLDSNRGRSDMVKLPAILSHFWNSYLMKNPSTSRSCGDYGGNIEVTGDNVLIIGNTSTPQLQDFFKTSGYKNNHIVVETDWLLVGHCDEYLSIIPNKNTESGYTIVKADPLLGLKLIKETSELSLKTIPIDYYAREVLEIHNYLNDKNIPIQLGTREIQDYKKDFTPSKPLPEGMSLRLSVVENEASEKYQMAENFVQQNIALAKVIDSNIEAVCKKITEYTGNKNHSIVSFPVMYHKKGSRFISYLPGVVNQLVLRQNLVIPDPKVASFRRYIYDAAKTAGFKVHFLDNMLYHTRDGEIHCGTNVLRHPNKYIVKPKFLPAECDLPAK